MIIIKEKYIKIGCVIALCFLISCGMLGDSKNDTQVIKQENDTKEDNNEIVSFYEVYRLPDKTLSKIMNSIPEIEGFITSIYDYQKRPRNVVGMTDTQKNKEKIMGELLKLNLLPENAFFCWSKRKIENSVTNEAFYHLYLLKETKLKIRNEDILKADVLVDKTTNEIDVVVMFNEKGTNKWTRMTEKAAWDNNHHIAIVVDSQVYACPYIKSPDYAGLALIVGFEDKAEAKKIVSRIRKLNNQ